MYMDVYLFMYINTCLGMRISVFTYIAMHIHTKTVLAFSFNEWRLPSDHFSAN